MSETFPMRRLVATWPLTFLFALACDSSGGGGGFFSGDASRSDSAKQEDAGQKCPADFDCHDPIRPWCDPGADACGVPERDAGPAGDGGRDAGLPPCSTVVCGANAHCVPQTNVCECDQGFTGQGGACVPVDPGDPAVRPKDVVCERWIDGHTTTASYVWSPGPSDCDPGTLEQAAIDDAIRRLNMFRWLAGLNAVTYDVTLNEMDQKCAIMIHRMGYLSHSPDPSVPCYTQEGASGAGSSNLAMGTSNPADAVDLFIDDGGVPSLGHRRWILNPPYGPAGIGFAGSSTCWYVFGMSGGGQADWIAWPNPGYTPIDATRLTWSWSAAAGTGTPAVKITRTGDGTDMPVTVENLPYGMGPDTIAMHRTNWEPQAGEVYRVELSNTPLGTVAYEVKPVNCP